MPKGLATTWLVDTSGLDFIDRTAPEIVDQAVKQTVEEVAQDIKQNWSESSPSAPGQPPAIVTGYLDSTIRVLRRDALGRFATVQNAKVWTIRAEAEYAMALEFGNPVTGAAPRPFLRPAIERATELLGKNLAVSFKTFETIGASGKMAYLSRKGLG